MKNAESLDVVIIYSEDIARSASSHFVTPFPTNPQYLPYNTSYSYFLHYCKKLGINAALSTSADIIGPGTCSNYWIFDGFWEKVSKKCYTQHAFVKFFPKDKEQLYRRELFLSDNNVNPFVPDSLYELFLDKMNIYNSFPELTIPTVPIRSAKGDDIKSSIANLRELLQAHPNQEDFSEDIIVKDRFGFGGNNIYKVEQNAIEKIKKILKKYSQTSFVIQPFVNFDKGTPYKSSKTAADIRLIYLKAQLVQTYMRFAKKGDFRCNQDQGGTSIYVDDNQIPQSVLSFAEKMMRNFPENEALIAIDFMMANSGNIYFLEGNSHPGIYWSLNDQLEEKKTKYLIHLIVNEFKSRLDENISISKPMPKVKIIQDNIKIPLKA